MTKHPPGPEHNLIFDWKQMRLLSRDFLCFLEQMIQAYGNVCGFKVGREKVSIVNEPALVNNVLTLHSADYYRTASQKRLFGRIVGNGLIVSDGSHWQRHRRLAQPAFHQRKLTGYFEIMLNVVTEHVESWPRNATFDFDDAAKRLTLELAARTLLGANTATETVEKVSGALEDSQRAATRLMKLGFEVPSWFPGPASRKLRRSVEVMDSVIIPVIEAKRNTIAAGEDPGTDLLSMFIAAVDSDNPNRRMTDEELRDETVTMLLAGHDTTANLLIWTVYLLSKHPGVWDKLVQEVEHVFPDKEVTVDGLRRLEYAETVLRESMRLYPPVYLILREPIRDLTLGQFKLEKGQMVMICPWLLHRNNTVFDKPDSFMPERFATRISEQWPAGSYIPFGAGPHQCIGRNFAIMETLVILSIIARNKIRPCSNQETVEPEALITLGVRGPLMLKFGDIDDRN